MRFFVKILGGILIIGSCTGYGLLLEMNMKKRLSELREIKKIMFLLKGEIEYGLTPIMEALAVISHRCNGQFKIILEQLTKENSYDKSFEELWQQVLGRELGSTALKKDEKERLILLASSLGLPDKRMQQHALDNYLDEVQSSIQTLTNEIPAKTRLYRCLGMMGGIIITIIIV